MSIKPDQIEKDEMNRQMVADPTKFIEFHINDKGNKENDAKLNDNNFRGDTKKDDSRSERHSKNKKKKRSRSRSYHRRSTSRSKHKSSKKDRHSSHSRSRTRSVKRKKEKRRDDSEESRRRDKSHNRRKSSKSSKRTKEKSRRSSSKEDKNHNDKRKRIRSNSRSAYIDMKLRNTENGSGYFQRYYERPHEDGDPNKPQLFWDGFQWVVRGNTINTQTFDLNTKPGRKIQIANIPLHLNISVNDLKEFIYDRLVAENYLDDHQRNIIKGVDLDHTQNSAVLLMNSIDDSKKVQLLDGTVLLGYTLRMSPYNESQNHNPALGGNNTVGGSLALANTAQLSAKSAAIAFAAIQGFSKDPKATNIVNSSSNSNQGISSKIIKVMNICSRNDVESLDLKKLDEIYEDMKEEFTRYGDLKDIVLIRPKEKRIGSEPGSVFVEYSQVKEAEFCMKNMKGKKYDGREIKCAYIDEEVYFNELKPKK